MKIDRFGFHKKFSVNVDFLDEVLDMEGSLEADESWEEATLKARQRMISLVESYAPPGSKPVPNPTVTEIQTERSGDTLAALIADIYSCTELKVLEGYRLLAKRKAKKEGRTFSDVVEGLLKMYLEAPVWKAIHDNKPLPTFPPEQHS